MSTQAANEIKTVVEKMKENLQKAEGILDTWSLQPLLKRSGKAQPVDDFEQLQKVTLKERYDVIKKGGAISASRRVGVSSLCRCDSYLTHDDVGGLFFDFERISIHVPHRSRARWPSTRVSKLDV